MGGGRRACVSVNTGTATGTCLVSTSIDTDKGCLDIYLCICTKTADECV